MEKNPVKPSEIRTLLKLKGWNQIELARELQLSKSLVTRWLNGDRVPSGPPSILMRQWLDEARKQPA